MIHAVTIDFWNTIVEPGNGARRKQARVEAVQSALAVAGYPAGRNEVDNALDGIYPIFEKIWFEEQRTLSPSECIGLIWDQIRVTMPESLHETVVHEFEQSILIDRPPLLEGAADAIRELAKRFRLAVISDTSITPGFMLKEVLVQYRLAESFSHFVFSDETGVSKPHDLAFRSALDALDVAPAEGVHIGDIERTDIVGAKNIGMKAILFCGKKNNVYQTEHAATRADARAYSWREVPDLIGEWNRTE
jgi:putative hydrolase of the HAD superfamily